jgi:hypothetical protein
MREEAKNNSDRWLGVRLIAEELNMNSETDRLLWRIWEWENILQRWCLESWQVTRNVSFTFHLIFNTMQSIHLGRKKYAWLTHSSRPWLCFFDNRGWFTMNSLYKEKMWVNSVIWKCCQGYGNLFEGKDPTQAWQADSPPWQCPSAWCVQCSLVPGYKIHYKNGPSTLLTWLSPLQFWLFPTLTKRCPEGIKIWWRSWHPMQHDATARNSRKRFSRLFPAVSPSSHKVHSFTRTVFWRWQQPLVSKVLFHNGHFRN